MLIELAITVLPGHGHSFIKEAFKKRDIHLVAGADLSNWCCGLAWDLKFKEIQTDGSIFFWQSKASKIIIQKLISDVLRQVLKVV